MRQMRYISVSDDRMGPLCFSELIQIIHKIYV